MHKQIITIFIIIFFLALFTFFELQRKYFNTVLKVINASEIQVDLNNNKIYDVGETVCIPDVEVLTSNLTVNQDDLEKRLNISRIDGIKFGYLSDAFADNVLTGKNVRVKFTDKQNQNCKFADITVNKTSYKNLLINSGFGITKENNTKKFNEKLEKAKKLNLVILNHKSLIFHKLDCEYGLKAFDFVIIPEKQLPKDAKPCKFCHIKQEKKIVPVVKNFEISNGSIKMYLNDYTAILKPDKHCNTNVCKEIIKQINLSEKYIDIALYDWDSISEIQNALKQAKLRGVKINTVYEKTNHYKGLNDILKLADRKSTDNNKALMHNKFIIFDGKRVITGSMNFSYTGFSGFNSNCVFLINSVVVAKQYEEEFNQMLNGKFHGNKERLAHKTVILGNTVLTPLFSPKDYVITEKIIPLINNARSYIYIPTFVFTHDNLSEALIKAKQKGVDVKLIVDAVNTANKYSKVKMLRAAGVNVKIENYAGKLHSKSIIIDDKYVISGSMNFSNSGENKNDENCLIIENEVFARYYKEFFKYLWNKIPDRYLKQFVRAEGKNSIGSCSDGIDNNFDKKIDSADDGCKP